MNSRCSLLAFALLAAAAMGPAEARLARSWSYEELFHEADFVVIAAPVATRSRGEYAALPDIAQQMEGKSRSVIGLRVETTFKIVVSLKGQALDDTGRPMDAFLLHHYSEVGHNLNGPLLVSFDPSENAQFLMFLKRGYDGQYVAVSGQTDPWFSIEPLRERRN